MEHTVNTNGNNQARTYSPAEAASKKRKVFKELKALGMSRYGLMRSESRELPFVLHDNEQMKGIVYGHHEDGYAMMVATDRRVLFLDKKFMFVKADEVTYDLVGGVTYGASSLFATVTLHTRLSDYKIRTMNFGSAKRFIEYIEQRCLEHTTIRREFEYGHFA